ncbi:MAG: class I SAM-dependent methyltransferase [Anaerolineaceae bacterium]|nr:class I SAM-dependent methyltransferase [Anaerolineaceae bacterium]
MPDHRQVYQSYAQQYQRLVGREDYQNNIVRAINQIGSLDGLDAIELGAGTGRLTCLFAPQLRSILALDISNAMLEVAGQRLRTGNMFNSWLAAADHRSLPAASQSFDLAFSGWSIAYLVSWSQTPAWQIELDRALSEMRRVLRPGGRIVLLETLGTGFETPTPPEMLWDYFRALNEAGFESSWMRTDYRFETLPEAEELACFFFGDELAEKVVQNKWVILPECTGMWWKKI